MCTLHRLVNQTRGELVSFARFPSLHAGVGVQAEVAGNFSIAAVTTWYLLQHPGDAIAFLCEPGSRWPFPVGTSRDLRYYRDVTDEITTALVKAGVLSDARASLRSVLL